MDALFFYLLFEPSLTFAVRTSEDRNGDSFSFIGSPLEAPCVMRCATVAHMDKVCLPTARKIMTRAQRLSQSSTTPLERKGQVADGNQRELPSCKAESEERNRVGVT